MSTKEEKEELVEYLEEVQIRLVRLSDDYTRATDEYAALASRFLGSNYDGVYYRPADDPERLEVEYLMRQSKAWAKSLADELYHLKYEWYNTTSRRFKDVIPENVQLSIAKAINRAQP